VLVRRRDQDWVAVGLHWFAVSVSYTFTFVALCRNPYELYTIEYILFVSVYCITFSLAYADSFLERLFVLYILKSVEKRSEAGAVFNLIGRADLPQDTSNGPKQYIVPPGFLFVQDGPK
jgi:hypothetical protein